jgi:UPF0042 nucleotide-binding protein
MRLVIISGRSGSGKSTALHVMEDAGFYCIDNLPAGLLPPLLQRMEQSAEQPRGIAVSIDARNMIEDLSHFGTILSEIKTFELSSCQIVYLDARQASLITRFSETRRKHPLSNPDTGLREALEMEKTLLEPIREMADIRIDTTELNLYDLRERVREQVAQKDHPGLALVFQSFGFKNGVPVDADFVFDVRCLPNPHWHKELRPHTGQEQPVIDFLGAQAPVRKMLQDITRYLEEWLPDFENSNRHYLTVAIGCTGGKHRSVFLCEQLRQHFQPRFANVQIRHRELGREKPGPINKTQGLYGNYHH